MNLNRGSKKRTQEIAYEATYFAYILQAPNSVVGQVR
jgi:hypothetical protein